MSSINLTEINAALTMVSTAIPIIGTAYTVFRAIWLDANPGKTEADFVNYLQTSSQLNINDSAAILRADGYVENPPGTWTKPPTA